MAYTYTRNEYALSASPPGRTRRQRPLAGLPKAWLWAYGGVWALTLALAAGTALSTAGVRVSVRHLLRLSLKPDPAPQLGHVLALTAHNVPIISWPLLLGVIGAHRSRLGRGIADAVLAAYVFVNILPVGAALGAYGTALLPYIPQLPLEWAALALGASTWIVQRHRALSAREGAVCFALIVTGLLAAAALETVAVPHL